MSTTGTLSPDKERPARRVRDEVKDGLKVVAASAAASTGIAVAVLLLMKLAG